MDYNCKAIHETIIRDILDVVDTVKDASDNGENFAGISNKKSFKSISSATSNLTLVFPVITTTSLNIENASMISKAIERKAVSMLQMLFSAMCISDTDDGVEFIKQFHNNLKIDDTLTVDSFIDAMDKLVVSKESALMVANKEQYDRIKEDMRNINFVLPNSISESGLNSYYTTSGIMGETVIKEANDRGFVNTGVNNFIDSLSYGSKDTPSTRPTNYTPNVTNVDNTNHNYAGDTNIRNNITPPNITINNPAPSSNRDTSTSLKDKVDYFKNQLIPNDVKKSNELVPTTMIVNFISNAGAKPINTQIVIGVKAKIYPVDSMDIINRLVIKHKDKNTLMQFVRSTTREISFVRDFILAIDKAKVDALSQSNKGSSSKLWKILERRAVKSKVRRGIGHINDASAISTLTITQEEVEYMKKVYNLDIEKPAIIRPIMESLNFMCVVIVDETTEVAKFIFDTGNDIYEHLSFRNLERESSSNDYKKIVSLMSKMR